MKILVVGPQFPDSFARNIAVTLDRMGHQVATSDGARTRHHGSRLTNAFWTYAPRVFPELERRVYSEVVQTARTAQPALVLVTYGMMPPEIVNVLKQKCGGKVVCWYTDSPANLQRQYLVASPFDTVFVKEPSLALTLRDKLGKDAHYLPECCNPMWHQPAEVDDDDRARYGCDLVAQGSLHYYRARMLEVFEGYDLKIWGRNCPPWLDSSVRKHYAHHFVAEDEKAKAFQAAKIVLNTVHYSEVDGVNCTLFEAAGCGAFQISDWKPVLPDLFEPEREIVTFRTRSELKEKVDYYLAHPQERGAIAARACARAHREHTYEVRLTHMLEILGFNTPSPVAQRATVELRAG
jgi:spore maturation protein CgeB